MNIVVVLLNVIVDHFICVIREDTLDLFDKDGWMKSTWLSSSSSSLERTWPLMVSGVIGTSSLASSWRCFCSSIYALILYSSFIPSREWEVGDNDLKGKAIWNEREGHGNGLVGWLHDPRTHLLIMIWREEYWIEWNETWQSMNRRWIHLLITIVETLIPNRSRSMDCCWCSQRTYNRVIKSWTMRDNDFSKLMVMMSESIPVSKILTLLM